MGRCDVLSIRWRPRCGLALEITFSASWISRSDAIYDESAASRPFEDDDDLLNIDGDSESKVTDTFRRRRKSA